MESVAARPLTSRSWSLPKLDLGVVGIWALTLGLVLYLGVNGGGYGIVVLVERLTFRWSRDVELAQ